MRGPLRRFADHPHVAREVATSFHGVRLGAVALLTGAALVLADLLVFLTYTQGESEGSPAGQLLHFAHCVTLGAILILTLPLRVSGMIEGARISRGFDQLVVTGVSPLRLQAGNAALGVLFACGVLCVSAPFTLMAMSFGDLSLATVLVSYSHLLLFSLVIVSLVLAAAVVEREWFGAVGITVGLFVLGGLSIALDRDLLEVLPAGLAELLPARALWRQFELADLFGVDQNLASSALYADTVLFHTPVPITWFSLAWKLVVILGCALVVMLGPNLQFQPGLNTFGSVVLPGDRSRRRFQRFHWFLSRRVELRFLYENRPAWIERAEGPLRAALDLGVMTFLFATVYGLVYRGVPSISTWSNEFRLGRDDLFLSSFTASASFLAAWIVFRVDSRLRTAFRYSLGPIRFHRTTLHTTVFCLLLALLFGTAWRTMERASPLQRSVVTVAPGMPGVTAAPFTVDEVSVEGAAVGVATGEETATGTNAADSTTEPDPRTQVAAPPPVPSLDRYRSEWWRVVGATLAALVFLFAWSRVLSYAILQSTAARLFTIGVPALYYAATAIALRLHMEGIASLRWVAGLCPGVIFDGLENSWFWKGEPWPLEQRLLHYVLGQVGIAGLLLLLGILARRRARRLARRAVERVAPAAVAIVLVLGFCSLAPAQSPMDEIQFSTEWQRLAESGAEGDLPLRVEVSRGFGGATSHAEADFFTLDLENPTDADLEGTFFLRSDRGYRTEPESFFVSRNSRRTLHWRRPRSTTTESLLESPCLLEFEAGGRRLRLAAPFVARHVLSGMGASGQYRQVVVASPDGRPPKEWAEVGAQSQATFLAASTFRSLPLSAADYTGFGTVLLCDADFARINDAQLAALYDFVRLGGALVLCGRFPDLETLPHEGLRRLLEPESRRTTPVGESQAEWVVLEGGHLLETEWPDRGTVSIGSMRRFGPGAVATTFLDPCRPSSTWLGDAAAQVDRKRSVFWTSFQEALPRNCFPLDVDVPSFERHLEDDSAIHLLLAYLGVYALLLTFACLVLGRKRWRGAKLFAALGGVIGFFTLGVRPAVRIVTDRPGHLSVVEFCYFGPDGENAVQLDSFALRSAGKSAHRAEISGTNRSTFRTTGTKWVWYTEFLAPLEAQEDAGLLTTEPFELARWISVEDTAQEASLSGRAVFDPQARSLRLTLDPQGRSLPSEWCVVVSGIESDHHLWAKLTSTGGWPTMPFEVELSDQPRGTDVVPLQQSQWASSLWQGQHTVPLPESVVGFGGATFTLSPLAGPRVLVMFADEQGVSKHLRTEDLEDRAEVVNVRLNDLPFAQRAAAKALDGNRSQVVLEQRVNVYELPLEIRSGKGGGR